MPPSRASLICMSPAVSVIMPTFNRLEFLKPAVLSVLGQTFEDWELIIADDGSSEATREYLQTLKNHPRVQVILMPHTGKPSVVSNEALRHTRGEYVAFLDSDDLWLPTKLETQLRSLRPGASLFPFFTPPMFLQQMSLRRIYWSPSQVSTSKPCFIPS